MSCGGGNQESKDRSAGGVRLADIVRQYGGEVEARYPLMIEQRKALEAIAACRTSTLGGHKEHCVGCGHEWFTYKPCGNRHCPSCQWAKQNRWIESRLKRVLDTHYFHVVFTLPQELRVLCLLNRKLLFNLMFKANSRTLMELGRDKKWLGAELGIMSVLHTWSRDLHFHPHLHNVVTGGGLSIDGTEWVSARPEYLFPTAVMAKLFRGKFLAGLKRLYKAGKLRLAGPVAELEDPVRFAAYMAKLYDTKWIAYAKRPFAGPEQVITYLGRYTHRVAISNGRLLAFENGSVTIRTRGDKTATFTAVEFLRRFLLHVLPHQFTKIRNYGLLAPSNVRTKWARAKELIGTPSKPEEVDEPDSEQVYQAKCPECGSTLILRTKVAAHRSTPKPSETRNDANRRPP